MAVNKHKVKVCIQLLIAFTVLFLGTTGYAKAQCYPACGECKSCQMVPDGGGFACKSDDSLSCTSCTKVNCTAAGGDFCGSCTQLAGECVCRDGACETNYYCDPQCPSGWGVTTSDPNPESCTVLCSPCGNTATCYKGGEGQPDRPGGDPNFCVCDCDNTGLVGPTAPTGLDAGYPGNKRYGSFGDRYGEYLKPRLTWDQLSSDDWGKNVKQCTSGPAGTSVDCPEGSAVDSGFHAYQVYIYDTATGGSDFEHYENVFHASYLDYDGPPLDPCTEYTWKVRAFNRYLGGYCAHLPEDPDADPATEPTSYSTWSADSYFKTNCEPQIVSVNPINGYSGTEPDSDNGGDDICASNADNGADHNPLTLKLRLYDEDSCGDIERTGIWLQQGPFSWTDLNRSIHKVTNDGTRIKIQVRGLSTGACSGTEGENVRMELLIDNEVVKMWYVPNKYMQYAFNTADAVSPEQIKIRMQHPCCFWSGSSCGDGWRVLYVDKVRVNGKTFDAYNDSDVTVHYDPRHPDDDGKETLSDGRTYRRLGQKDAYIQLKGSSKRGNDNTRAYGVSFEEGSDFECNGGLKDCFGNYDWDVPQYGQETGESSYSRNWVADSYRDSEGSATSYGDIELLDHYNINDGGQCYREVKYRIEFVDHTNPHNDFDGKTLDVFGYAQDKTLANTDWVKQGVWRVDFQPPDGHFEFSTTNKQVFKIINSVDNEVRILSKEVFGGLFPDASGTLPYSLGSQTMSVVGGTSFDVPIGSAGTYTYTTDPIWSASPSRMWLRNNFELDIGDIDKGRVGMKAEVVDMACNLGEFESSTTVGIIGETWMTTKAGLYYSEGSIEIPVVDSDSAEEFTMPGFNRFNFIKDQAQLSSELLMTSGSSILEYYDRTTGDKQYHDPYVKIGAQPNTAGALTYVDLMSNLDDKISKNPDKYDDISFSGGTISGGKVTDYCVNGKERCIIRADNGLTLDPGPADEPFLCDMPSVIVVSNGDLNINNNVEIDTAGDFSKNGCIFVAQANISIQDGVWQSSGVDEPDYDLLQGYFIAFNKIILEKVDKSRDTGDGLKVDGSLIALGTVAPSIEFDRTLRLRDNNVYPAVAVHFDPRYLYISRKFFTEDVDVYRKGIGFKPY